MFRRSLIVSSNINNINFTSKRYIRRSKLPPQVRADFDHKKFVVLLKHGLGINRAKTSLLLEDNPRLSSLPPDHIRDVIDVCKKWNVDMASASKDIQFIFYTIPELTKRLEVFQEMGVTNPCVTLISRYDAMMLRSVAMFKRVAYIPKKSVIFENVLKSLKSVSSDKIEDTLEQPSELTTLRNYRDQCLLWYIQWRLNIPKENISELREQIHLLRHHSLAAIELLFKFLHHELGLTVDEIKEHKRLHIGTASELRKLVENMTEIDGICTKELLRQKRELQNINYTNAWNIVRLLKEHNFYKNKVKYFPQILLLPYTVIEERLNIFKTIPALQVLKYCKKSLLLVYKLPKVQSRLRYIEYLNMNTPCITMLVCTSSNFLTILKKRIKKPKTLRREDIDPILEDFFDNDVNSSFMKLANHPFWSKGDMISIHETIKYLTSTFEPSAVRENLPLILYPKTIVEQILTKFDSVDQYKNLTDQQLLAMCMYEIEREFHFSGNSFWNYRSISNPNPELSWNMNTSDCDNVSADQFQPNIEVDQQCIE